MIPLLKEAVVAQQSGNLKEAERLYRAILENEPNQPDALALLGVLCGLRGAHQDAFSYLEKAVERDPQSALFKFYYGNVLLNANKAPQAVVAFRQCIVLQPAFAEAHYNLANALRASGDWMGAILEYQEAIKRKPDYAEAYNNLSLGYVHEKNYEAAFKAAQKAVALAPHYGEGWVTVCNVAEKMKNYDLGLKAGLKAIELLPSNHYAWFGYGVILNRLDRHEEAIDIYKKALLLKPNRADIWDNLGQTYQSLNRLEEAEQIYRKTIEVDKQTLSDEDSREVAEEEFGNRHWHLALMELLRGKYKKGFSRYRARFKDVGGLKRPALSRPLWQGQSLVQKTILICDEQGFGDTLMLCRFLPILKMQGAKVIFSVHPVLAEYFSAWQGADKIMTHGNAVGDYDYYASVFDLPFRLGTTLESIPKEIPYLPNLNPDKDHRITDPSSRPKIGIVWGGNPLHGNDSRRSIPLSVFSKILTTPGVKFYSLNRDSREGDAELIGRFDVENLVPRFHDFAGASQFIGQMDLIITCDTATAHLAGGMGKAVWVLLPFAPDWRWLTDREDNPWYPTVRLFRQPTIGNWDSLMTQVKEELSVWRPPSIV